MKVNVAKTSSGSNPSEWPGRFDALFEAHYGEYESLSRQVVARGSAMSAIVWSQPGMWFDRLWTFLIGWGRTSESPLQAIEH